MQAGDIKKLKEGGELHAGRWQLAGALREPACKVGCEPAF